jgi:ATP-dependent RNA helicase DDX19/DBP5
MILIFTEPAKLAKSLADRISSDEPAVESKENVPEIPPKKEPEENSTPAQPETNLIQNKYQVAVKLQDMQADPTSPLYSVKSFEELGL